MRSNPPGPAPDGQSTAESTGQELYRSLVEGSPDVIAVIDDVGAILYVNHAARRLLGGLPDLGTSFLDLVHPDDLDRTRRSFEDALLTADFEGEDEVRVRTADGSYRWMKSLGRRLPTGPAAGSFLVQLRDITARREAQDRLVETERRLRGIVDRLPLVLFALDSEGVFTLSEGHALASVGLTPGQRVGSSAFDLYEGNPSVLESIRRALDGEVVRRRARVADRVWDTTLTPVRDEAGRVTGVNGVSLDVTDSDAQQRIATFHALLLDSVGQAVVGTDTSGRIFYWNRGAESLYGWSREEAMGMDIREMVPPAVVQPDAEGVLETLGRGEAWSGEYVVRGRDGSLIPVLLSNRPVMEDGEVVGLIGVASDLREMKRLEERLRQAQKMEAVGQLAGGVAHDFNNILTAIGGYASMASDRSHDPQVGADIAEVINATERARTLVDRLLAFSDRSFVTVRSIDLNPTVADLLSTLRRTLPPSIRLETHLAEDLWAVRADPGQIQQAILNLVFNARDAMPEGGAIVVRTDNVQLSAEAAAALTDTVAPGRYVRLAVQDTGVGMDDAVRARIFEPFFTTKEVGKGTGLGLSAVFGVVRHLGGGIDVQSRPGGGSRFCLYLPPAPEPAGAEPAGVFPVSTGTAERPEPGANAPAETPRGEAVATILLVEDEPAVRRLASRVLVRAGYRVIEAESAPDALDRIQGGAEPDLVLTDVIMPGMSGGELAERLRTLRPDTRLLFMSGYTADELEDRGFDIAASFLPKPFPPALLVEKVRQTLARADLEG